MDPGVSLKPHCTWLLGWEDLCVGDAVVDDAILLMDAYGPNLEHWPSGRREAYRADFAHR